MSQAKRKRQQERGSKSSSDEPLSSQQALFELNDGDEEDDFVYLDAAGRSPLLRAAAEAGRAAVSLKSKPWLMAGSESLEAEVRGLFASLVGASSQHVALAPSTAHAVTMAAKNVDLSAPRNCVLVMANQMASNVMPWQRAAASQGGRVLVASPWRSNRARNYERWDWTAAILQRIEEDSARLGCVAICQVCWCNGSTVDITAVAEACARKSRDVLLYFAS